MADRYCTPTDLLTGDVTLGTGLGDLYVNTAADEMDSEIGFDYFVPIDLDAVSLHIKLLLKRCNALIASGRLILSQATASEDNSTHAYGMSLLKEGQGILQSIRSGQVDLVGVPRVGGEITGNAPSIIQTDNVSALDAYYGNAGGTGDFWRPNR